MLIIMSKENIVRYIILAVFNAEDIPPALIIGAVNTNVNNVPIVPDVKIKLTILGEATSFCKEAKVIMIV